MKSMTFNILAGKEKDLWVAHCLELDIVATSKSLPDLKREMSDLIRTQIDYAFSNNNLDNLYHPAPPEVWALFYACKKSIEKKIEMKSEFQKGVKSKSFIPPWITTNVCINKEGAMAIA